MTPPCRPSNAYDGKPLVAGIQIASPIAVKSFIVIRGVFNGNDFALLDPCVSREHPPRKDPRASLREHLIKFDKPHNGPTPLLFLSRFHSFLVAAELNDLRNVFRGREEDMHNADPHSLSFSYIIDSSFERNRVGRQRKLSGIYRSFRRNAVDRIVFESTKIVLDDHIM